MQPSEKALRAKISAKGWVVIPARLRKQYGLRPGTSVAFHPKKGKIVITAEGPDPIDEIFGKLADGPSLTDALLESRTEERNREENGIRHR